jgi:kinesin family protein 15
VFVLIIANLELLQTDTEINQPDLNFVEEKRVDTSEYSKVEKSVCHKSYDGKDMRCKSIYKDVCNRDVTIILLKKEIEFALESLMEVQAEMVKLHDEKKQMWISEKQNQESMKFLISQVLTLESAMSDFEKQSRLKMEVFSHRVDAFEQTVEEAGLQWCQTKEVMLFLYFLSQKILSYDLCLVQISFLSWVC